MTTSPSVPTEPRLCPNCSNPIPPGRRALCPNCHHPLILDEQDQHGEVMAATGLHKPTETEPAPEPDTVEQEVPPPQQNAPVKPGLVCPSCQYQSPPALERCERCSTILVSQPTMPVPLPPPTPEARPPRTGLGVLMMVGALVLALALGYVAFQSARPRGPGAVANPSASAATPLQTAQPTRPPELRRIRSSIITVKASSTLPDPFGTYKAENTLDGDLATAWNSDGDVVGATARVTLTYRFKEPRDLRAIEIGNGYQRSTTSFYNNSRVRRLLVSTDSAKLSFELLDRKGRQTISGDFGRTDRVVLTVEAVYRDTPRKTVHKDCAVSEVAFFRI